MRLPPSLSCHVVAFGLALLATLPAAAFEWEYSTPEEQGVDSAQLAQMFAQVQRDAVAIHSFILVRHGRIVSEAYVHPYTAGTRHAMYSVSKSFTSALLGIAIDRGLISGVDASVTGLFQGVTDRTLTGNITRMQLRHLLTMSTGHANDTTYRITGSADWARAFLELPVEEEPGSRFVYNSGGSYMIAAAVQRQVGMTAAEFARQNLFGPLGIVDYTWDTSPNNVITGGWGLMLRPLDMARFGLLYLHNGEWEGRQIVSQRWVEESSRRQMNNGTSGFWGSGYGYQFWLNDFGGYRADGAYAQYIFILPQYDAVAVFTSQLSDSELPARLMRQYVLPAMQPGTPLGANPRGVAAIRRAAAVLETAPGGAAMAPSFTNLPVNRSVSAGGSITFTVSAAGSPAPSCQWFKDEMPVAGANALSLTRSNVTVADAGRYVAVIRNSSGVLASPPVTLTVLAAPTIVEQPTSMRVAVGAEVELAVSARGEELQFQWRRNGMAIAAATSSSLFLPAVGEADAGDYSVEVTNPRGSVASSTATLAIAAADEQARLVNLSARAWGGSGDDTVIVGFVVGGTNRAGGLPVLLRGVGPSLAALGVNGAMEDPATVLFVGHTPTAANSEWGGGAALTTLGARLGAYALPARSADAAGSRTLAAGAYTLHVQSSLPDRAGIVLAECYDARSAAPAEGPRLVNLSARARVGPGDQTLIGGFVIAGRGEQRVLLRGIGPTLAAQQVTGVLADPELQLFEGPTPVVRNDNWGGDPALRAAFATTGAFELPADSADAALLVTLRNGVYSVHLTGKNGTSGVALVEIYAVP